VRTSTVTAVRAIDVHAHIGRCVEDNVQVAEFMTGDAERVVQLAARARTAMTVVSSLRALLPPNGYQVIAGNEDALAAVEANPALRLWAVLEPRLPESFAQVEDLLRHPCCVGIKIHPELHQYPIGDYGREIFAFAARLGAVVQTHSGQARSLPEDFVPFADAHPEVNLILSHLGFHEGGDLGRQVRAIQRSRHGNVYTDTSSMRSLVPCLLEWAVAEVGAEHILFGTDSPLYFAPMQRARVDQAEMPDAAKRLILRDNAKRLLRLRL
jgi:uncharacterized protein